jgi:hypothetical protein
VDDLELIAGMLAAGSVIVTRLNEFNQNDDLYINSSGDVSAYRLLHLIPEEKAMVSRVFSIIRPGHYGMWMPSGQPFSYNLYTFRLGAFFQGVVTICKVFQVDYRDYVYKLPFDSKGNDFIFQGYELGRYDLVVDVIDLDDVEEEEKDNENIIEPLRKE